MSSTMTTPKLATAIGALRFLATHVHAIAASKGFHDEPVPMAVACANLHGEVSELWEAYRRGMLDKPCDKKTAEPLTCLEEELADIIIRRSTLPRRTAWTSGARFFSRAPTTRRESIGMGGRSREAHSSGLGKVRPVRGVQAGHRHRRTRHGWMGGARRWHRPMPWVRS
jgi:hypothetical protein